MHRLVLLRHGESEWNKQNRFTGWTDVDLSEKGVLEAHHAGKILKKHGFSFDIAYTSVLKRAIRTLWIVLDEMDLIWIPVEKSWRLNERHYGALQGLNKAKMIEKHSEEQVHIWRRSYDVRPPALTPGDDKTTANQPQYRNLNNIPVTESLKDTYERLMPYWQDEIAPRIEAGDRVLISAHGNSLRALVKHLNQISDEEISQLNIPTGIPLVFELDENLEVVKHYYLEEK